MQQVRSLNQRENGVALLQVLLIALMIGTMALGIAINVRGQLNIASGFLDRMHAEMKVVSALNLSIFDTLVNQPVAMGSDAAGVSGLPETSDFGGWDYQGMLNQLGAEVAVQDLGGLLPQAFPRHPLWQLLLRAEGFSDDEVRSIVGLMTDVQDQDDLGWNGEYEPAATPLGYAYPNVPVSGQYAMLRLVEHIEGLGTILRDYSHPYSAYSVSLVSSPPAIVRAAYAGMIDRLGVLPKEQRRAAEAFLSPMLTSDNVSSLPSPLRRYSLRVVQGDIVIGRRVDIELAALSTPPFLILGKRDIHAETGD